MVRRTCALALALVAGSSAVALAATASHYSGATSQHERIGLTVTAKRITKVVFTARYGSCGSLTTTLKPIKLGARGSFSATQRSVDGSSMTKVKGRLKGTAITGSLTGSVTEGGIHPRICRTGKVTFSAKLAKPV